MDATISYHFDFPHDLFNISPLSSPSITITVITMSIIIHNFSHFQHLFTLAASCPMDNTIENRPVDWTPQICLSSACPIPRVMPEGYVGHSEATVMECPGNEFFESLTCFTCIYLKYTEILYICIYLKKKLICWNVDSFQIESKKIWGDCPGWQLHLCAWLCPAHQWGKLWM